MIGAPDNDLKCLQVAAGDTVRFKPLTLPEAAALRVKTDEQVALLGKIATGGVSATEAESQLQVCMEAVLEAHTCQTGSQLILQCCSQHEFSEL